MKKLIGLTVCVLLTVASAAHADFQWDYSGGIYNGSGSLTWSDGIIAPSEITAPSPDPLAPQNAWANSGTKMEWTVTGTPSYDPDTYGVYSWHYDYTLTVPEKAISHLIIETSTNFTVGDITNVSSAYVGPQLFDPNDPGKANPLLPGTIFGLKFSPGTSETLKYHVYFDTLRAPVWGDFYAKDGQDSKQGDKVQNVAWDAGFSNDNNPAWTAPVFVAGKILVPDSVVYALSGGDQPAVPVPSSLLLCTIGLAFATVVRRLRRS